MSGSAGRSVPSIPVNNLLLSTLLYLGQAPHIVGQYDCFFICACILLCILFCFWCLDQLEAVFLPFLLTIFCYQLFCILDKRLLLLGDRTVPLSARICCCVSCCFTSDFWISWLCFWEAAVSCWWKFLLCWMGWFEMTLLSLMMTFCLSLMAVF